MFLVVGLGYGAYYKKQDGILSSVGRILWVIPVARVILHEREHLEVLIKCWNVLNKLKVKLHNFSESLNVALW